MKHAIISIPTVADGFNSTPPPTHPAISFRNSAGLTVPNRWKRLMLLMTMLIVALGVSAKSPKLEVEKFFDGRFNKEKYIETSIIKENGQYYRTLNIRHNAEVVDEIIEAVEKEIPRATKYVDQMGGGGRYMLLVLSLNGGKVEIGVQQSNPKSLYLFIKGPLSAFQ